jgi:hypothetical protein
MDVVKMDFSNTGEKKITTKVYPVHAEATSGLLTRCEPLLGPDKFRRMFLKGIPLRFRNGDRFTNEDIQEKLNWAMNEVELLIGATITREAFKQKVPFDYSEYKAYIQIRSEKGPMISLEELAIVSADDNNIFTIPPTWIETSNFAKRLINVIPLLAAYGVNQVAGAVGNAGIAFLTVMDGLNWVPAYWQIRYTAGLSNNEGQVPANINELIGVIAAIAILSEIAATFIYNSQSQSQDGISQSSSGPGPHVYDVRIAQLEAKRDELVGKFKAIFSTRWFIGNI